MDILLIEPPYYKLMGEVRFWIPIGLMNLAHFLTAAGMVTQVYNADATPEFDRPKTLRYSEKFYLSEAVNDSSSPLWRQTLGELGRLLEDEKPKAVGISVKSDTVVSALTILRFIRRFRPETKLFVGGAHFTSLLDQTFFPLVDAIIVGEGEEIIEVVGEELTREGRGRGGCRIYRSDTRFDVNRYMDMDFSLLTSSQQKGIGNLGKLMISSSRGCPFHCAFCFKSIDRDPIVRYVSGELVAKYMIKFYENYGIAKYYFVDDTFGLNQRQLLEFSSAIKGYETVIRWSCMSHVRVLTEEKLAFLKELGCSAIHLGVESGSQRMLDLMQKNIQLPDVIRCADMIHQYGIELRAFILFGVPGETAVDLALTKQLLKRIRPDEVAAQVYVPYNNTSLYHLLRSEQKIEPITWSHFIKSHLQYGVVKQHVCDDPLIEDFFRFVDEWNSSVPSNASGGQ